jgi:hypothetical protein
VFRIIGHDSTLCVELNNTRVSLTFFQNIFFEKVNRQIIDARNRSTKKNTKKLWCLKKISEIFLHTKFFSHTENANKKFI